MGQPTKPGQIIILNGAPRSGKSSIVTAIQETFEGLWMNLGVDVFVTQVTPKRYRPGMGLRPGEEGHKLAPRVAARYAAMYESIAAHSRRTQRDRKSTRLNSSHVSISYAVSCF